MVPEASCVRDLCAEVANDCIYYLHEPFGLQLARVFFRSGRTRSAGLPRTVVKSNNLASGWVQVVAGIDLSFGADNQLWCDGVQCLRERITASEQVG